MKYRLLFLSFLITLAGLSQTTVTRDTIRVGDSAVVTQKTTTIYNKTVAVPYVYKDTTVSITQYKIKVGTTTPPPTNQPPIANAGADFQVQLPATSFQLNGSASSDVDNGIKSYGWRKIFGGVATITDTNKSIATVTNFVAGVYRFELRVVDNGNVFRADTVTVTVQPQVTPPTGNTYNFTIPRNTAWKARNFAGYEDWNGQNYTQFGNGGFKDKYFRFVWTDIEKVTQGNYVWTRFDQEFQKAINVGAKFSFGIFMVNDSDDFLSYEVFNNVWARYPKYVHDRMQTEAVKDYIRNNQWIPNWNSTFMLDRYDALLQAVQAHIVSKGWQDKINYIDIRGYGQWGEWHSVGFGQPVSSMPAGTRPTVATYKRFIDGHIAAFPNYPLVMLMAALDAEWLDNTMTPREVTDYILKARNNWGLIGIRRDQWGATDNYIRDYFENNTRSFGNSGPFNAIIMERYKYAPLVGEPMGPGSNLSDLPRQVTFYKAASIGNGNYTADATSQNYFRQAEDIAGYKLSLTSGQVKISSTSISVSLSLENIGTTPCYEDYNLVYQLKNSGGVVVGTFSSNWKPALKLKGVHTIPEETWFVNLNPDTYTLTATFKNSYRTMPLFNNGQATDGSIVLYNQVKL